MCFGGGGGDGGAAAAAAQEKKRQENIRKGTFEISKIFDGAQIGDQLADLTAAKRGDTLYMADGTPIVLDFQRIKNPEYSKDNKDVEKRIEQWGYRDEDDREFHSVAPDQIYSNTKSTGEGGFGDKFYQGLEKSYMDFANPELERQFNDARKQLIFALGRSGTLASSSAAQRQSQLEQERARYQTDIVNRARSYSNSARSDVEDARDNLIAQLTATEDPSAAAQGAVQRASVLSRPPAFDPIGEFAFQAAQGLNSYLGPQNGYNGVLRSPLFQNSGGGGGRGGNSGSVRYNN